MQTFEFRQTQNGRDFWVVAEKGNNSMVNEDSVLKTKSEIVDISTCYKLCFSEEEYRTLTK